MGKFTVAQQRKTVLNCHARNNIQIYLEASKFIKIMSENRRIKQNYTNKCANIFWVKELTENISEYICMSKKWMNDNPNIFGSQFWMKINKLMELYLIIMMKNPAYGRHQLFWPMRIVGPIQIWRGCVIYLNIICLFFFERLWDLSQKKL